MPNKKIGIKYSGSPIHFTYNNVKVAWKNLPYLIKSILTKDTLKIDGWSFYYDYYSLYKRQNKVWKKSYLSKTNIKGKIILDIGAGCGETAKFFLEHGAKHIIAVENNPDALPFLKLNAKNHPLTVIGQPFNTKMLEIPHDFMKMDIEGYEILLLIENVLPHYKKECIINVHGNYIFDEFINKFGFEDLTKIKRIYPLLSGGIVYRGPT